MAPISARQTAQRTTSHRRTDSTASGSGSASGTGRPSDAGSTISTSSRLTAPTIASAARSNATTPHTPRGVHNAASASSLRSASRVSSNGTPVPGWARSAAGAAATAAAAATSRNSKGAAAAGASKSQRSSAASSGGVGGSKSRAGSASARSSTASNTSMSVLNPSAHEQEAIKAFLRIRPAPEDAASREQVEPYIKVVSNCEVLMTPPSSESGLARARAHAKLPATKYTFARVFGPEETEANNQASFFQQTTLPMVQELLQGDSGLIFTYGVTNSGKSYTVQGGTQPGEAGLLPRALDVVFNSIDGLESRSTDLVPVGLYGVERVAPGLDAASSTTHGSKGSNKRPSIDPWSVPSLNKRLAETSRRHVTPTQYQRDTTKVKVDRNYRYSVWVSYVEVYNERLFDLLDVGSSSSTGASSSGMTRSDSMRGSTWSIAGMASSGTLTDLASIANNGPITLNRRPLSLKTDPEGGGKYVSGLREVRIESVSEARELLKRGQENRIVFSTMANRASSRSHGVFTIKVVREHAGAGGPDESLACTVSRLSIVDLAGSERISNTSTSGQRQKEAGSINKSLMCLGQCVETLRKNQARAASMIPMMQPVTSVAGGTKGTGGKATSGGGGKRRPSVVPFRHSKLTELFQPFFTGEGRTVMIVNANPYDTGFDENSHVMKFSAVAKEVHTAPTIGGGGDGGQPQQQGVRRGTHRLGALNTGSNAASGPRGFLPFPSVAEDEQHESAASGETLRTRQTTTSGARTPTSSMSRPTLSRGNTAEQQQQQQQQQQHEVTILEESDEDDDNAAYDSADEGFSSENGDDDDDADDGEGAFIDLLIQRHEELRERLYQAEVRCAEIEAEVREEMAEEMSHRLREMEQRFEERLLNEEERNEEFWNKKVDLLVRSNNNNNNSSAAAMRSKGLPATAMETPRPKAAATASKANAAQSARAVEADEGDVSSGSLASVSASFDEDMEEDEEDDQDDRDDQDEDEQEESGDYSVEEQDEVEQSLFTAKGDSPYISIESADIAAAAPRRAADKLAPVEDADVSQSVVTDLSVGEQAEGDDSTASNADSIVTAGPAAAAAAAAAFATATHTSSSRSRRSTKAAAMMAAEEGSDDELARPMPATPEENSILAAQSSADLSEDADEEVDEEDDDEDDDDDDDDEEEVEEGEANDSSFVNGEEEDDDDDDDDEEVDDDDSSFEAPSSEEEEEEEEIKPTPRARRSSAAATTPKARLAVPTAAAKAAKGGSKAASATAATAKPKAATNKKKSVKPTPAVNKKLTNASSGKADPSSPARRPLSNARRSSNLLPPKKASDHVEAANDDEDDARDDAPASSSDDSSMIMLVKGPKKGVSARDSNAAQVNQDDDDDDDENEEEEDDYFGGGNKTSSTRRSGAAATKKTSGGGGGTPSPTKRRLLKSGRFGTASSRASLSGAGATPRAHATQRLGSATAFSKRPTALPRGHDDHDDEMMNDEEDEMHRLVEHGLGVE